MEKNAAEQLLAYDWNWRTLGGANFGLYTTSGGSKVVLMGGNRPGSVLVRDAAGRLNPIAPDDSIAILLRAVPAMIEVLNDLKRSDDRPRQLAMIEAALALAGDPQP